MRTWFKQNKMKFAFIHRSTKVFILYLNILKELFKQCSKTSNLGAAKVFGPQFLHAAICGELFVSRLAHFRH